MVKRVLAWLYPSIGGDEFGHHTYTIGSVAGLAVIILVLAFIRIVVFPV